MPEGSLADILGIGWLGVVSSSLAFGAAVGFWFYKNKARIKGWRAPQPNIPQAKARKVMPRNDKCDHYRCETIKQFRAFKSLGGQSA